MAARAYWQGQIRLALVSIPVEVHPATPLIEKRSAPFDASEFKNRHVDALRALTGRKARFQPARAGTGAKKVAPRRRSA